MSHQRLTGTIGSPTAANVTVVLGWTLKNIFQNCMSEPFVGALRLTFLPAWKISLGGQGSNILSLVYHVLSVEDCLSEQCEQRPVPYHNEKHGAVHLVLNPLRSLLNKAKMLKLSAGFIQIWCVFRYTQNLIWKFVFSAFRESFLYTFKLKSLWNTCIKASSDGK